MFIDVDIISDQIPILKYDNIRSSIDLIIVPYKVAFILSILLPISSKLKDRGDCIYWNKQNGARNLK